MTRRRATRARRPIGSTYRLAVYHRRTVRGSGRLALTVLAGVSVVLLLASAASARMQYGAVGPLRVGPVIAGAGMVTVEGRKHPIVRWYPATHGAPRVLRMWTRLVSGLRADEVAIAGNERLLVVATDKGVGWPGLIAAGAPLGRPRILARCQEEPSWQPQVDGTRVLFNGPPDVGCRGAKSVQLRDLADPTAGGPTGIAGVESYRFAYPFAAFASVTQPAGNAPVNADAVVWDLRSRSEAYRLSIPNVTGGPSVAVGATGTLVLTYSGVGPAPTPLEADCGLSTRALIRTLDDPVPRPLSNAPCFPLSVLGGTVVGLGAPTFRLVATHLSGGPVMALSPPALEGLAGGFSIGDRHFAFALARCAGGERIVLDELARAARDGPGRADNCPASLHVRRRPLGRDGSLTLAIACPKGCMGELELVGGGKPLEVAGGARASEFRVPVGRTVRRHIQLGRADVDWLRTVVRLRTRIDLLVVQPDGDYRRISRVVMLKLGSES
jgi:hypothetical protein